MICAVMMVMLGARAAQLGTQGSLHMVCHMGTPMCAQAESSGAPRAQKGLRDKARGAVWVLGSGAQNPQLCQQHCASHPAVGHG